MSDKEPQTAELRENLIATAVKFLQNPKVRESPFAQRRTFLQNKGLTNEEIEAAIAQSGTADDEHAPVTSVPPQQQQQQHVVPMPVVPVQQPESAWKRAKDYLATAILIGGVSYAVYAFYKKYIMPVWFGPSKEQQQLEDVNKSVKELQTNIAETLRVIQEMQVSVKKQQESLETLIGSEPAAKGYYDYKKEQETVVVNEVKDEMKALKSLLLTRLQFPSAPRGAPVVPSWQLETKTKGANEGKTQEKVDAAPSEKSECSGTPNESETNTSAPAPSKPQEQNDETASEEPSDQAVEQNTPQMNGATENGITA